MLFFLQRNAVLSAASDGNALPERENSVISGRQQLAHGQKTVISANLKGSIKQTNTSQVLVSETVPDMEGPAEQTSQDDKVWGQPCDKHCVYST